MNYTINTLIFTLAQLHHAGAQVRNKYSYVRKRGIKLVCICVVVLLVNGGECIEKPHFQAFLN